MTAEVTGNYRPFLVGARPPLPRKPTQLSICQNQQDGPKLPGGPRDTFQLPFRQLWPISFRQLETGPSFCDICWRTPHFPGGEFQFERRFTSCPSEEASFILPHFLRGRDGGTKKQAQEMPSFASLHFSELLWHN